MATDEAKEKGRLVTRCLYCQKVVKTYRDETVVNGKLLVKHKCVSCSAVLGAGTEEILSAPVGPTRPDPQAMPQHTRHDF